MLNNLAILNLEFNQIEEIKVLNKLVNLVVLYLQGNKIKEIKNLEQLEHLGILNLMDNQITDIQILKKMKYLYGGEVFLWNNPIPHKQWKEMEKLFEFEFDI